MRKSIIVSAILASITPKLYGLGMSDEEFAKRMGVAQQKIVAADQLESGAKEYDYLREQIIYSQKGIVKTASGILLDSSSWVDTWKTYLLGFDRVDISDYTKFLADSQSFYAEQAAQLKKIEDRAEDLRRSSVDEISQIAFHYNSTAELSLYQRSLLSKLQVEFETLKSAVQSSSDYARRNIGLMRLIQQKSVDAIELKIKKKLLAQGTLPLESSLARYRDMSAETVFITPVRMSLQDKANRMSDYSLNFALNHAMVLKKQSDRECSDSREQISSSSMSNASKNRSLKTINGLCESIDTNWSALIESGLTSKEMAFEYASLMKTKFEDQCQHNPANLDCKKLELLRDVPKEFYDNASDSELLDIEFSWSSIDTNNK